MTWEKEAACKNSPDIDPDAFFPVKIHGHEAFEAKRFCLSRCPVTEECLAYALEQNIQYGVWGGLDGDERKRLRRRMSRSSATNRTNDPDTQPLLDTSEDAVAS